MQSSKLINFFYWFCSCINVYPTYQFLMPNVFVTSMFGMLKSFDGNSYLIHTRRLLRRSVNFFGDSVVKFIKLSVTILSLSALNKCVDLH